MRLVQKAFVFLVRFYQWVLSPIKRSLFGPLGRCRFSPSCSDYAVEALERHGAWRGTFLALRRLVRCQPWGGCGWDPVPPAGNLSAATDLGRQRANKDVHQAAPHADVLGAGVK